MSKAAAVPQAKAVAANACGQLQRKLAIGTSNDPLERAADRIADEAMSMPGDSNVARVPARVQRLTRQTAQPGDGAPASVDHVLRSAGRPLEPSLQQDIEQRFGHDFSKVRVHCGAAAEQSARDVNARAYAVGHDLVFGVGQFAPGTQQGRHLLAHELAHVLQQSGAEARRGNQSKVAYGLSSGCPQYRLQRAVLENDPGTAPPMRCPIPTAPSPARDLTFRFAEGSATLSETDKMVLAGFATEWNLSPLQPMVRVDGFASIDGGPATNWPLSCDRALAVAGELSTPSLGARPGIPAGSVEYFANGETEEFSTSLAPNRVATIYAPGVALPTSREPSVFDWSVSNSGTTDAANCCSICPVNLGVDCDSPNFKNGIELTASIRDHDPAYAYDIKRTKEARYHRALDLPFGFRGPWQTVSAWNKPAGTLDDAHDSDECLVPQASGSVHKVFSEDRPGFRPTTLSNTYSAYIGMLNFVEFVRIRRADASTYDDPIRQNWHSKLLVEKNGGSWSVNTAQSEIDTGHLSSLNP